MVSVSVIRKISQAIPELEGLLFKISCISQNGRIMIYDPKGRDKPVNLVWTYDDGDYELELMDDTMENTIDFESVLFGDRLEIIANKLENLLKDNFNFKE